MMSVEYGLEKIILEDDLAIHTSFVLNVSRKDGLHVRASIEMVKGRHVCRALELSTDHGEIDRKLLSGLGLATMIQQAAMSGASRVAEATTWNDDWSEPSRFDAGVIRSELKPRHIHRVTLRRPWRFTDEFLEDVADTYRSAVENHRNIAEEVGKLQKRWVKIPGVAPPSTVGRWIDAARKRGFLQPTTKGRKGG